jgi:hypothetical protein
MDNKDLGAASSQSPAPATKSNKAFPIRQFIADLSMTGNGAGAGAHKEKTTKVVSASFEYQNVDGTLAFVVDRIEFQKPDGSYVLNKDGKKHKKEFCQRRQNPGDDWLYNMDGVGPVSVAGARRGCRGAAARLYRRRRSLR